jgi:hypothetical protein
MFLLLLLLRLFILLLVTGWRGWLSHCATIREVAGSIPEGKSKGKVLPLQA